MFEAIEVLIHPLMEILPFNVYSLESGHYFGAFCYYFIQYIQSILLYISIVEYALIVLERKMAIQHLYSMRRPKWTDRKMLINLVSFTTFIY